MNRCLILIIKCQATAAGKQKRFQWHLQSLFWSVSDVRTEALAPDAQCCYQQEGRGVAPVKDEEEAGPGALHRGQV